MTDGPREGAERGGERTNGSHSSEFILQVRRTDEGETAAVDLVVNIVEGVGGEGSRAREDLVCAVADEEDEGGDA